MGEKPQNKSFQKLSAIIFVDIVGYTKLMQIDEEKALNVLKHFSEVLEGKVGDFNGVNNVEKPMSVLISFLQRMYNRLLVSRNGSTHKKMVNMYSMLL